MPFPEKDYRPPGVYTETLSESPITGTLEGIQIPVLLGEGNELLGQSDLEIVRGSSSFIDQQVTQENQEGRAVVSVSLTNQVTLGNFDGVLRRFQVRHFPIVDGNGNGVTTYDRSALTATINGTPVVVTLVDGANGIVELIEAPKATDVVRCTYFFNRTDTKAVEDLSNQVSSGSAEVRASFGLDSGDLFEFNSTNNIFKITVDQGNEVSITIPLDAITLKASLDADQVAAVLSGASVESLVASSFVNNYGQTALLLTADEEIVIGSGSANAILGFQAGISSGRNKTFYTFHGPIVDGLNGGVTTTDPAHVTVKVNNVQVIPVSVDGQTRAITLPFPPKSGSTISVTYYHNTWQDTYDFVPNIGIQEIVRCGVTPGRSDFVNKVDFLLKDDVLIWGTAALASSGVHTSGYEYFGSNQVTPTLVDNKIYLDPCTAYVDTSVVPSVESQKIFTLSRQPTSGNGRNSPLGSSLFQTVSNNRIDLPTERPDLVVAYWGYSIQDALDRGPVTVLKVDSANSRIELKDAVPKGASVYATYYYNILTDHTYTLTVVNPGISGVGSYTITDEAGVNLLSASFDLATKGSGLSGVTIEFPSGSELTPDVHLGTSSASTFVGPVEEIVTVTFAETQDTPAKYAVPGNDPYYLVENQSDKLRIKIDNADLVTGATGIDLSNPTGKDCGFSAQLLGEEAEYDASTGGASYTILATNNGSRLDVDGVEIASAVAAGATKTLADFVNAINTAAKAGGSAAPLYKGATQFLSSVIVVATEYQTLTLHYTGDVSGASGNQIITLAPGTYNTAADLAAQVNTQLATINGAGFLLGSVTCTADSSGRLVFALARNGADASGFLEFVAAASADNDFAILAGIDTDATALGAQTKIIDGDIAKRFTVGIAPLTHDRLILRNRIIPGGGGSMSPHNSLSQTKLEVLEASGNEKSGLTTGRLGLAAYQAVLKAPSLLGQVGFAGGQITGAGDATDSQPGVTFYDGSGTKDQNNEFKFTLDGYPVSASFTASGAGTLTALGPASVAGTVMDQIVAAMAAIPGTPFGNAAAIKAANLIRQEGAGFRITSPTTNNVSELVIGDGNANSILGFDEGQRGAITPVQAGEVVSALMGHAQSTVNFALSVNTWATPAATYFAAEALAGVVVDASNNEYLYLQSQSLGTGSIVEFAAATADDALRSGTLLLAVAGDGAVGEAGISGFFVESTDPSGSGSANTSVLNSGAGQDGVVGQTYIDAVTGLTFTILPRAGNVKYPTTNATFRFQVTKTILTNSNIPVNVIPGVELLVTDTSDINVGDTALVETFERGGNEPSIGDLYYVSYTYLKESFDVQLYTKLSLVERAYGTVSPDNPVSLGSYLGYLNGAVIIGIKQAKKAEGSSYASVTTYRDDLDTLKRPLGGGLSLDVITPLFGSSTELFQYLSLHLDVQSSTRYRQERTAICGFSGGTSPADAGLVSEAVASARMRFVYPDVAFLSLTDALGNTKEYLVEGTMIAAALMGSVVSPNFDVATPWTGRQLVGFNRLGRVLDAVEQNQIAVRGITVIDDRPPFLVVRQGFTSDMSTILTRIPTVTLIGDVVHQRTRNGLQGFVGIKFLPGISSQVEGRFSRELKALKAAQIIAAYTGLTSNLTDDPTVIETEAFYAPVFPLLYLLARFHLRSRI